MSFERRLRQLSRSLPVETPPARLRVQMLDQLPEISTPPQRRSVFKLALAVAAALAVLWIALSSRSMLRPVSAANVRAAIQNAQTWRFTGWRLAHGKPVRWEIWGRRRPFFYREQFGDDLVIDDGKRRIHFLPPSADDNRSSGVAIILPSQTDTTPTTGDSGAEFLTNIGHLNTDSYQVQPRNSGAYADLTAVITYSDGTSITQEKTSIHVDKKTLLPLTYIVQRNTLEERSDPRIPKLTGHALEAKLTSEYNLSLPPEVFLTPATPAGYTVANATTDPPPSIIHQPGAAAMNGLTVKGEVAGRDAQNRLYVQVHGWLGATATGHTSGLSLMTSRIMGQTAVDDLGRIYLEMDMGSFGGVDSVGSYIDFFLIPLEPMGLNEPAPKTITMQRTCSIDRWERQGRSGNMVSLLSAPMTMAIPVPSRISGLALEERLNRGFEKPSNHWDQSAAEARAFYYTQKEDWKNAERWRQISLSEAAKNSDKNSVNAARANLAALRKARAAYPGTNTTPH